MNQEADRELVLAVLIDADNASASIVEGLLAEIARFGIANIKRIYGDWTTPHLSQWKEALLNHSIQPVQQFRYTTGKNATDSAMIIDAMDLLYTNKFTGFCLVSSDSDFTRLAGRIRESGVKVYGFGEEKTPRPFVAACDRFVYTEVFRKSNANTAASVNIPKDKKDIQKNTDLLNLIYVAVETISGDDGWAALSGVGSYLNKVSPNFDPRSYGFNKLSGLIIATHLFEIDRRGLSFYIKEKKKTESPVTKQKQNNISDGEIEGEC